MNTVEYRTNILHGLHNVWTCSKQASRLLYQNGGQEVWLFVLLILTSAFTESLGSILTTQKYELLAAKLGAMKSHLRLK